MKAIVNRLAAVFALGAIFYMLGAPTRSHLADTLPPDALPPQMTEPAPA